MCGTIVIRSSSGAQLSRGRKRPNTSSALALMEPKRKQHSSASAGTSQAPLCRPWDRGDLMRRLAAFKSMRWFAKPKVQQYTIPSYILFPFLIHKIRLQLLL
jgi:hypothetical protein